MLSDFSLSSKWRLIVTLFFSEPNNSIKGLEILGLRDAKKIVQLMRLLVSGKIGFAFPETNGIVGLSSNADRLNIKSFTQRCIGYLCSAIKMLTHNDPDTYTEIMRLCSEVSAIIEYSST